MWRNSIKRWLTTLVFAAFVATVSFASPPHKSLKPQAHCPSPSSVNREDRIEKLNAQTSAVASRVDAQRKLDPALKKAFREVCGKELGESYDTAAYDALDNLLLTGADRLDLENEELVAIYLYTGFVSPKINSSLRAGGERLKRIQPFVDVLNSALKKLPDYTGPVYRGTTLPDDVLKSHTVDAEVTYAAYTSTSVSVSSKFGGKHQLQIFSVHGKNISAFSSAQTEKEVLFAPGTRFVVGQRMQGADGTIEFILKEVTHN